MSSIRQALRLATAAILAASPAMATTATDHLTVTATVLSGCSLTGGSLSFGQYVSGQAQNLDAAGQINYANCTGNLTFELDGGNANDVNNRAMSSGSDKLKYQLYKNTSRTAVWGIGTDAYALQLLSTLTGSVNVYGRIPSGQTVPAGTYNDVVNITLTF
jgi:spore coat protein U-like protein